MKKIINYDFVNNKKSFYSYKEWSIIIRFYLTINLSMCAYVRIIIKNMLKYENFIQFINYSNVLYYCFCSLAASFQIWRENDVFIKFSHQIYSNKILYY